MTRSLDGARLSRSAGGAIAALLLMAIPAAAQWRNLPMDGVPLGPDGKPNMSAPAPKTSGGKPDLSGIYTPNMKYFRNLAADIGLENVPMTDEARKIHKAREDGTLGYDEPDAHCLPQGVPKINMAPVPFKIVQTDKLVVLVYEAFNLWRQVHLDGREFADDLNPSWLGYSKGRWEGDDAGRGDARPQRQAVAGSRRSSDQRQAHGDRALPPARPRPAGDRAHDHRPHLLHQPWTVTTNARRLLGTELFEFICNENEKSREHMGPHIK